MFYLLTKRRAAAMALPGILFFFFAGCDTKDNNDDLVGAAALLLVMNNASASCGSQYNQTATIGGLEYQYKTDDGATMTTSGSSITVTGGGTTFCRINENHPLLSMELGYTLGSGGSLELYGGTSTPGTWGNGFIFKEQETLLQGSDGAGSVLSADATAFDSGTTARTVCAEVHMGTGHTEPHILLNWSNGGCNGLTTESQADSSSEDLTLAGGDGSLESTAGLGEKKLMIIRVVNATLSSASLQSSVHFEH